MPVANGRKFLSIPGPTNVPDQVLQAMMRPAVDIYSGDMLATTETLLRDLKSIFRTDGAIYLYAGNGHAGWEAAFTNVLSKGDKVLVLESGRFAVGWGEMASFMGVNVEILAGSWHRAVDPQAVTERLKRDTKHAIKAILVVQIDTASGVVNDIPAIRKAINAAKHPALYMVDTVASLGCMPFEMDAWGIDVAMGASQKGLMTPAGLAIVAANARAREIAKTAGLKTLYWDWAFRDGEQHYMKYCGTPPEHHLWGLRAAVDMLMQEGLEQAWTRHRYLAAAVHAAVSTWAEGGAMKLNIEAPHHRSPSTTTVLTPGFVAKDLLAFCRDSCGVTLGVALGALDGKGFRIAHMGHVNAPMVLGTLSSIELGLKALGIPHAPHGVSAAIESLTRNISTHSNKN